jgi:hypothetical protein
VLARALEKKAGNRYTSWGKFLDDLSAAKGSGEVDARVPIDSATDRFNAVRGCKFFKTFPDAAIWDVLEVAEFRRVTEGDVLIREGDVGDFFFIVVSGRIRVSRRGRLIDVLSAGRLRGRAFICNGRQGRAHGHLRGPGRRGHPQDPGHVAERGLGHLPAPFRARFHEAAFAAPHRCGHSPDGGIGVK